MRLSYRRAVVYKTFLVLLKERFEVVVGGGFVRLKGQICTSVCENLRCGRRGGELMTGCFEAG